MDLPTRTTAGLMNEGGNWECRAMQDTLLPAVESARPQRWLLRRHYFQLSQRRAPYGEDMEVHRAGREKKKEEEQRPRGVVGIKAQKNANENSSRRPDDRSAVLRTG
ncbi:hypothetical protein MTO96_005791 [Rhipicephalus appendiculatus]